VPPAYHLQIQDSTHKILLPLNQSSSFSTLTSLDWRAGISRHLGNIPGQEVVDLQVSGRDLILLVRNRTKDAWLYTGTAKRRLTTDGANFTAAMSPSGDLLLSKQSADGTFRLWWQRADGALNRATDGPEDVSPDVSRDGASWAYVDYVKKTINVCSTRSGECRTLRRDELLPTWPRLRSVLSHPLVQCTGSVRPFGHRPALCGASRVSRSACTGRNET
jgi:hypothetical protein